MQKLIVKSANTFKIGQTLFVYDEPTDTIYAENGEHIEPNELNIVKYENEMPIWGEDWSTLSAELLENNGEFVYFG